MITAYVKRENPHSGIKTIAFTNFGGVPLPVMNFLAGQGRTPFTTARKSRINSQGEFTFLCGGGYNVLDKDLLGGTGDGETYRQFQKETGETITIYPTKKEAMKARGL